MPFKWSYPVIHAVPEILITIMDSPVPIFLGLNLEKNSFIEKNYNNVSNNIILKKFIFNLIENLKSIRYKFIIIIFF